MKDFHEDFEGVLDLLKDKIPFAFTRFSDGELYMMQNRKYKIEKDSRIGYPVGIGYPPTWGELTTSLRKGDKNIIYENMTFHCIPALWMEKFGIVISETFVVKKKGAERLTNYNQKLFDLKN